MQVEYKNTDPTHNGSWSRDVFSWMLVDGSILSSPGPVLHKQQLPVLFKDFIMMSELIKILQFNNFYPDFLWYKLTEAVCHVVQGKDNLSSSPGLLKWRGALSRHLFVTSQPSYISRYVFLWAVFRVGDFYPKVTSEFIWGNSGFSYAKWGPKEEILKKKKTI